MGPNNVLNCVKMFAMEARNLQATIATFENRVFELNCGLKGMMSSGELQDLAEANGFWDSLSEVDNFRSTLSCETRMDGVSKVSQIWGSDVQTNDDSGGLSFLESSVSSGVDTGKGGDSFTDLYRTLSDAMIINSAESSGEVGVSFTERAHLHPEESDAMPIKEGKQDITDVATKLNGVTDSVVQPLEPQKGKFQKAFDSLVLRAAQSISCSD